MRNEMMVPMPLRHAGCLAPAGQYGSNHPLVGANPVDKSAFLTDTIIKDLVGWVLGAIGFTLFAFGAPIALGHPDNSIHANPLTTPAHIVPEWYFLALYAILRSIPNKQAGVVAVALVIFTLILLGWGSMVSKNRCVTGAGQPLPIPRGVYAIADALHLFWILGAGVLIVILTVISMLQVLRARSSKGIEANLHLRGFNSTHEMLRIG
jgi:ubiquinol-cytochrome c reductase cytochrome b subunit